MTAVDNVDELIERYHLALGEFMKGNPEPAKRLWSAREDASLTNPQGSVACGWAEVAEAMDRAASTRRSGRFLCKRGEGALEQMLRIGQRFQLTV